MTRELLKVTRRGGVVFCLAGVCAVVAAVACGPKPPPPHILEVPIDQFDNGGPRQVADGGASVAEAVVATTSEPVAAGSRPSALATQAPAASGPPPGQRLTAVECDKMLDKGAIQFGISKSMSVAKAMRSIPALRTQAQSDSTFAQVTSSCTQQNSKTQYACAMKSTTFDKWKTCLAPAP